VSRSLIYLLCSALLIAFGQAPGYHIHQEGHAEDHVSSEHRRGWVSHTHVAALPDDAHDKHPAALIEGSEDESGVVDLNWFQIERQAPVAVVGSLATTAEPISPDPPELLSSPGRPRIHDPPLSASLIPRAPPA
jgi:hypothetical protein